MRALLEREYGTITEQTMMKIMEDHEQRPKSICPHVDPSLPAVYASMTVASFVMLPRQGRMFLCAGPPCEYEYAEYPV